MTTATIHPVEGGTAVLAINGVDMPGFPSWRAAADEAEARGMRWELKRFGPTPIVLAESPGLRVLT